MELKCNHFFSRDLQVAAAVKGSRTDITTVSSKVRGGESARMSQRANST